MLKVMVQNLFNYDYKVIELPATEEEVKKFFDILNPGDLHDCEIVDVEITDEANELNVLNGLHNLTFNELNQLAEKLEEDMTFAYVFAACENLEEAIQKFENGDYNIYYDCHNDYDLGFEIATQNDIVDPNDDSVLARYFNFEAYGRDYRLNGNFTVFNNVMIEIN